MSGIAAACFAVRAWPAIILADVSPSNLFVSIEPPAVARLDGSDTAMATSLASASRAASGAMPPFVSSAKRGDWAANCSTGKAMMLACTPSRAPPPDEMASDATPAADAPRVASAAAASGAIPVAAPRAPKPRAATLPAATPPAIAGMD